jgi:ribosomal protein S12 methylthiotransferase accessory factor
MDGAYADALAAFAPLVDEQTGLIRSVDLLKLDARDPVVYMANAEPCDTVSLTGIAAANRGAACSTTPERAIVRACGESIERYCSAFFDPLGLRLASEDELRASGERFISVRDVYPFADWQYEREGFPYERVAKRRLRWVPGTSAFTSEEVWLPASCVYVPYLYDAAVEPFTHMPISTGLAAGPTLDACIEKGILEILERDALMLVWYGRIAVPRIDVDSCRGRSAAIDQLLAAQRPGGPTWHFSVLTLDIDVPVIGATLIDPGPRPLTSFGISADRDPERALLLALEEAALTRVLLHRSEELKDPAYVRETYDTLRGHLLAHASSAALRERLRFMTDDGPLITLEEFVARERAKTTTVTERMRAHGHEPIWADVTTDDVADFSLRVARTVVAGMQPLDNDHRHRYLGGRRLPTVLPRFGSAATLDELNPDPHPFP